MEVITQDIFTTPLPPERMRELRERRAQLWADITAASFEWAAIGEIEAAQERLQEQGRSVTVEIG